LKPSKKVVPENSVSRTYALEAPRTREESIVKTETSVVLDLRKSDEDGILKRATVNNNMPVRAGLKSQKGKNQGIGISIRNINWPPRG
jgi:hypothetical protein